MPTTADCTEIANNIPDVPAWLNLDEVLPPELRAQIQSAAWGLEEIVALVSDKCEAAYQAIRGYEKAGTLPEGDDLRDEIDGASGLNRLYAAAEQIAAFANCANGDNPPLDPSRRPTWFDGFGGR